MSPDQARDDLVRTTLALLAAGAPGPEAGFDPESFLERTDCADGDGNPASYRFMVNVPSETLVAEVTTALAGLGAQADRLGLEHGVTEQAGKQVFVFREGKRGLRGQVLVAEGEPLLASVLSECVEG